jgi:transposase
MLVRSAKWSWLKAWAMKIARHRGMNKAIVALARRLTVIMHRIWVDGTEFPIDQGGRRSVSRIKSDRRKT